MTVPEKIHHAILDPRWKWGKVNFDGSQHIFITMHHPEHMDITCLVPRDVAKQMAMALLDLAK
jgi:hypothetical protein